MRFSWLSSVLRFHDFFFFFFQAEDGIRDSSVTGVQTCALPIYESSRPARTLRTKCRPEGTVSEGLLAIRLQEHEERSLDDEEHGEAPALQAQSARRTSLVDRVSPLRRLREQ